MERQSKRKTPPADMKNGDQLITGSFQPCLGHVRGSLLNNRQSTSSVDGARLDRRNATGNVKSPAANQRFDRASSMQDMSDVVPAVGLAQNAAEPGRGFKERG